MTYGRGLRQPAGGADAPDPKVSALSGAHQARKREAKLRAWSVTEEDEGSGGIIFAKHGIVALKNGACQFGSVEWEYYKARRAPWADSYATTGELPASVMVQHGWHFECCGCGVRIDEDLPEMHRRYRDWTSDEVVGSQYQAWCTSRCHDGDMAQRAVRKRWEGLYVSMMERLVKRRFPTVRIINDRANLTPHVYIQKDKHGFWRLDQAIVSFDFPGMATAPASYRWDRDSSYGDRKPHFTCCVGDKDAFEAFARDTDGSPEGTDAQRQDGEAVAARAEGIAKDTPASPPDTDRGG